ncbi:sulfate anion transporter 1 [Ambystoma mexicanum]|uniref:sulfate anion transporter 1 n=1 Tax=Ambystoma mexicanum TaxID=8296 RepID=UPI0037E81B62
MNGQMESHQMEIDSYCPVHMERKVKIKTKLQASIKAKVKKNCTCTTGQLKNMLLDFFPVLRWLPKYKCKEYIWGDVMSGLIIGIILVPQAIAYSLLAGIQPIYSLYTSFFANVIYFIMGTSRHVSVGIFSLLSLMVGQVVDRELQLAGFDLNEDDLRAAGSLPTWNASETNATLFNFSISQANFECGKECYAISIATALTFLAGVYQVMMAIFHLGFLSIYLSEPMLDGFATGASLTILTAQVKYLLGIKIPRSQGFGMIITTWINIFQSISGTNVCDVITSAICIAVLVAAKELGDRYKKKLKIPLPTELVVIVVATLISHFCNLNKLYGSSVSGDIPTGFIAPKVPDFGLMPRVALDAIPLAVVSFAFTVSLSEMFAKKYSYTVKANQEMFAIGFCNIIPSFFHCFATSAALAKTLVKSSTGCQTQVSSVISAVVVLLVLLFFAPLFYSLQKCVLACIIIVSLREALRKFRDLPVRWQLNRVDTGVWLATVLSSALISTEMGLLIGIIVSMLAIIGRTQRPHASLLSQIQNTVFYEDSGKYENLCTVAKIKIFRFEAPLYYANKVFFQNALYKLIGLDPALELAKRKKIMRKQRESIDKKKREIVTKKGLSEAESSLVLVMKQLDVRTIIIDCSSIPFVDTAGVNTLKGVLKDYKDIEIGVLLACCNPSVIDSLERAGYFGKDNTDLHQLLFYSVHSAVLFARENMLLSAECTV